MAHPAPRPPALKLLNGRSPGRDSGGRKVQTGVQPVKASPKPPTWLPAEAKAEWKRITPELERLGLLTRIDRSSLTAYCLTWTRLVDAQKQLAKDGILATNSQGRVRHPAVAVIEAATKELRSWAAEFGLTPSARGRMSTPEAAVEDDLLD